MGNRVTLRLVDLVFMNFVAVTALRWTAAAATAGPSAITLWILATLLFFVPQALCVAQLSGQYPGEGGIYTWTQKAFGDLHGFLCGWCYWINNLLYFPTLLLYVTATLAVAWERLQPHPSPLARQFAVLAALLILWGIAGLSILGLRASRWVQNVAALGNWVPIGAVVGIGWFVYHTTGSATALSWERIVAVRWGNLPLLAELCFALAGLEMLAFFRGETNNTQKLFTLAIPLSSILILSAYLMGTLGILISVPEGGVTLINGILQPFQRLPANWAPGMLSGLCALLIALGGIGTTLAWFSGASRLPYVVGVDRHLPEVFSRQHPKWGTPHVAILLQTGLATFLTFLAAAGDARLETIYRVMVDMCLVLYFIPYCYLFLAVPCLQKAPSTGFRIPGGYRVSLGVALLGFATTLLGIVATLVPMGHAQDWLALSKTVGGSLGVLLLGAFLYLWNTIRGRTPHFVESEA